jgi:hypothetical protein
MADGSGKMSRGAVVGVDSSMMSGAETDSESTRLRNIQQASDTFTIKHRAIVKTCGSVCQATC